MQIKVLYNNEALPGFKAGWGFSALIVVEKNILFDTGGDVETLAFNAEKLGVDKSSVDCCFISHMHGDHTGGLGWLDKKTKVFLPGEYDNSLSEIGVLVFDYPLKEQVLVYKPKKLMLVGCSHPGIVQMARKAVEEYGKLRLIVGGFHLFDDSREEIEEIALELRKLTEKIAPCHCTGGKGREIFRQVFSGNFVEAKAGKVIKI